MLFFPKNSASDAIGVGKIPIQMVSDCAIVRVSEIYLPKELVSELCAIEIESDNIR
jgi:hypothetical protein